MNCRTASQIWEAALGELEVQVNKSNYRTWFEKTQGLSFKDSTFTIGVPNAFVAEYLDRNQRSLIEKTLFALTGPAIKLIFQVTGAATARRPEGNRNGTRFNPRYTFESFITGERNRLARDAAMKVAQSPGLTYNPLFIYGGTGLGKTHLLHAIGQVALTRNLSVLMASAEQFLTEFVSAIKEGSNEVFHNRYRSVDILLIDDIQFIAGKKQTEESFFHTFNALHGSNRQIVMTSDRAPTSLSLLEDRLCSRFEWGLTADVKPPERATRLAILQEKNRRDDLKVPDEVLEYIAARDCRNIRQLEGALNRVTAFATLVEAPLTTSLAAQALEDIGVKDPKAAMTPAQIVQAVAASFKLTPDDLKGPRRDKAITLARHVAMFLIRKETGISLAEIGRELGGRDHSTVVHACNSISDNLENDPFLKRKLLDIQQAGPFRNLP